MLGNILIPTDGSVTSLKALPYAVSLASNFNARITLFHVQELYGMLLDNIPRDPSKPDIENLEETLVNILDKFLDKPGSEIKRKVSSDGSKYQLIYTGGEQKQIIDLQLVIERNVSAHYAITEYAEKHADIVVMTTHGRSGLSHLLLGSTAEKVAQHLKLPVLTIKPK